MRCHVLATNGWKRALIRGEMSDTNPGICRMLSQQFMSFGLTHRGSDAKCNCKDKCCKCFGARTQHAHWIPKSNQTTAEPPPRSSENLLLCKWRCSKRTRNDYETAYVLFTTQTSHNWTRVGTSIIPWPFVSRSLVLSFSYDFWKTNLSVSEAAITKE